MVAYHGTRILSDKWALQAPKSLGILCGRPVSPWGRWVEVAPLHVWQIISSWPSRWRSESRFALVTEILVHCKFYWCWAHQTLLMGDVFCNTRCVSRIGFFGFASMRMMIRGWGCKNKEQYEIESRNDTRWRPVFIDTRWHTMYKTGFVYYFHPANTLYRWRHFRFVKWQCYLSV